MFPSFLKISQPPDYKQEIGKQCCLPLLPFKIRLNYTSCHISLNSLGFYLSPEMFVEFFLTCIFHHVWEKFSIYGVHIPRKCIESMHFF